MDLAVLPMLKHPKKLASIAPKMAELFPKGSGMTEMSIKAEASSEIWQDGNGFLKIRETREPDANKIAADRIMPNTARRFFPPQLFCIGQYS